MTGMGFELRVLISIPKDGVPGLTESSPRQTWMINKRRTAAGMWIVTVGRSSGGAHLAVVMVLRQYLHAP